MFFPMCGSRGGTGVQTPPPEKPQNIGFLSKTGPNPLKNHKCRFAWGLIMAQFWWYLDPLINWKKENKLDPLWKLFLDPRMFSDVFLSLVIKLFHRGPYKPPLRNSLTLPMGSVASQGVFVSVFLRKPIETCDFPGGWVQTSCPHFGSVHGNSDFNIKRFAWVKVSKGAKIRNRYNQVPHLTLSLIWQTGDTRDQSHLQVWIVASYLVWHCCTSPLLATCIAML